MEKMISITLAAFLLATGTVRALPAGQTAYEGLQRAEQRPQEVIGVCPPATNIGGVLALGALTSVIYADMKRREGDRQRARSARRTALGLFYGSLGSFAIGYWTAVYYDNHLGIKTYIRF